MKAKANLTRRRTLRLNAVEDENLRACAAAVGLTVSAYIRRRCFGGRPLIAKTDQEAIRELRRLGGLLKHSIATVRQTGDAETLTAMNATLQAIKRAMERLDGQA